MTDNQAQVDRIENKLDKLLDEYTKNKEEHVEFKVAAKEIEAMRKKFWPLMGALTVLSPIVTGLAIYILRGVV